MSKFSFNGMLDTGTVSMGNNLTSNQEEQIAHRNSITVIPRSPFDIPFGQVAPPNRWDGRNQCDICAENIVNCVFRCGHPLCYKCPTVLIRRNSGCPVCRSPSDLCFALRLFAADTSETSNESTDTIRLDVCQICNTKTTVENVFAICGHTACSVCAIHLFRNDTACPFCNDRIIYLLKVYL